MKKYFSLFSLVVLSLMLTWCFKNQKPAMLTEVDATDNKENIFLTAFWTEPFWDLEVSWWIASLSSPMYDTDYSEPVRITKVWDNYYFTWEELEWEFIKKDCVDWWKWDLHYYTVWVAKFRDYYYEGCWDDDEWIKMTDEEYEATLEFNDNTISTSVDLSWIEWFIKNCESYSPYWLDRSDVVENISYSWKNKQNIWKSYSIWWEIKYFVDWKEYTDNVSCIFNMDEVWDNEYYWYLRYDWISSEKLECLEALADFAPEWMVWDPQTIITMWCWEENYGEKYITWYLYTTTYPDLWLRITTPTWYDTFFKKADAPIFKRNWDRISYWDPEIEYLQVYEKAESDNLLDIIKKNHLNKWCVANEFNYYSQKIISADYPWTIIYDIFDESWMMPWECIPDDEWSAWDWKAVLFFESKDKTKYYKLVKGDWCAPWPCSMFWEIEIF